MKRALLFVALLPALLPLAAKAASTEQLTAACRLVYPQVGSSKSIIWSGTNGTRAVVLGLGGDRLECLFAENGTGMPTLTALQIVLPSGGVAAYAGKRLAEWNKLIASHFGAPAP